MKNIELINVDKFTILDNIQSRRLLKINHRFRVNGIFIAFIDGRATIKINNQDPKTEDNIVLLMFTYTSAEILYLAENTQVRLILYPDDLILKEQFFLSYDFIFSMHKYPCCLVEKETIKDLMRFASFIDDQQNITNKDDQIELNTQLLYALFLKLKSMYIKAGIINNKMIQAEDNTISNKFHILLFQHFIDESSPSFYANKLNISSQKLSSIIEEEWGNTIENWHSRIKINFIKIESSKASVSLEDIAGKFKFSTIHELEMFFEQHTGQNLVMHRK
ncbi:MAG: hypothetical protein ACK5KT_09195 [Dysgonomonas sp.]